MKLAFLTSYNSDLFKKNCEKYFLEKNENFSFWWNSFGTQEQSVFDPTSQLYSFDPEIIIIHFEIEWLLGDFCYDVLSRPAEDRKSKIDNELQKLQSLIRKLIEYLPRIKIVFEDFITKIEPFLGVQDYNMRFGLNEIVNSLNNFLFDLKEEHPSRLFLHDYSSLISMVGKNNCFDNRLHRLAKNPFAGSFYNYLFEHYFSIVDTLSTPRKKCIVVDLDNTLWGGIVGQDGIEHIDLGGNGVGEAYVSFQKILLNFYRKGVFLAVCSKNNFDDAIEIIEKHPDMILRKKYFSSIQINWSDKAFNIRTIAKELNIGTDSIVFLDDNPAECELVKQQIPEVEVVNLSGDPDNYIKQLARINSLQTVLLTSEDLSRNIMRASDEKRKELELNFTNLDEYYKSLEMQAKISVNEEAQISRISQLTQKTNQFNLTTKRYAVEDIKGFLISGKHKIYTLRLTDRFGDNGIVIVAIVAQEKDEWAIDTFLMSCRVIGRQAETAMLNYIIEEAHKAKIKFVKGEFIKTKKNTPAENFLQNHGFSKYSENGWRIPLPAQLNNHYIKIITES